MPGQMKARVSRHQYCFDSRELYSVQHKAVSAGTDGRETFDDMLRRRKVMAHQQC